ncbi:MAG: hypothetical protein JO199_13690, partial [Candidatus Eremiobacteraeota bacterium]|nr:hypothetical protein [Candidatus Eremiobacteraeota bacterium]
YVDHGVYETASLLRFIEVAFGLPFIGPASAGYTDSRALAPVEAFDFAQRARTFYPVESKYPAAYFLHHKPSLRPPDTE